MTNPAWKEKCPTCGEKCVGVCKCFLNDRTCANNHWWRRDQTGRIFAVDGGHGKEIKAAEDEHERTKQIR